MLRSQNWELHFRLPYLELDMPTTFDVFGCKLSLNPIDANHSEGHLQFKMEADSIDKEKAATFGKDWIQVNLIDSYLVGFGRDLKPEYDVPNLLNESELASIPKVHHADFPISVAIRVPLPTENIRKSFELRTKINMNVNKDLLERSLRWFRKAKESVDTVDRFVMQWIAFNALYSTFNPDKKGDAIAIKNLINEYPDKEKIREILVAHDLTIKKLGTKELKDWHEQKNYSDELRDLIGTQDIRRILMAAGLCLWVVRSETFHGGTMPSQEADFIRECSQLLERIYRECFCSYVGFT